MLKNLLKDSVFYALANGLQKLTPFLVIPVITNYLGSVSLKIYDISFVYAYLFSWLIILGQDSAASIFYFSSKDEFNKRQVLNHGLLIQMGFLLLVVMLFLPFREAAASILFGNDYEIQQFWLKALMIIPGHTLLNYILNMLIWQKKKRNYILLCLIQVIITTVGTVVVVVYLHGTITSVFNILIAATVTSAVTGLLLEWRTLFSSRPGINLGLLKRLVWVGVPFALTSFFHQLLPSIDRFFLLKYHNNELPEYALAVKIGGCIGIASSAFALAFTPYSMNKINEEDGERDISTLFRFISVMALVAVPVLLLFRNWLIDFFADSSYQTSARLLPIFFFAWVFDLFSYFSMLGIYKSKKSHLYLMLFASSFVLISLLNSMLIPKYGVYGAATSFLITKAALFFVSLFYLRKYFRILVDGYYFFIFFAAAAFCSYFMYTARVYQYIAVLTALLLASAYYLYQEFRKHRQVLTLS